MHIVQKGIRREECHFPWDTSGPPLEACEPLWTACWPQALRKWDLCEPQISKEKVTKASTMRIIYKNLCTEKG